MTVFYVFPVPSPRLSSSHIVHVAVVCCDQVLMNVCMFELVVQYAVC